MINIEEKERILSFIRNPIKTGFWETVFEWNKDNKIVSEVNDSSFPSMSIEVTPLMVLEIFNFLVQEKKISKANHYPIINNKPVSLQNIDDDLLKNLKTKFKDFDKNYDSIGNINYSFNNGVEIQGEYAYILQQPHYSNLDSHSYNNIFIILSTSKKISDNIETILRSSQCITNTKQRFIRSPQTKLVNPIFDFTKFVSNNLFTDWENIHYFNEAYNLYYQQKYDNSISYIGKMTESLLTNIYESLFQEHVPDGFAIGQIQNSLQSRVKDIYRNDRNTVQPANFEKIIEDNKNKNKNNEDIQIKSVIMMMANLLKNEQKYRNFLIEENQSINIEHSIFPKNILGNLKKLLNYRNAVSHNSGTFFNIYDCQKMLFYFLSIHNWWQETYDMMDWTGDKIEIIKRIVENRG
jgi:hypothetical protein